MAALVPVIADRQAVIAPVDLTFVGMVVEQTTNAILKPGRILVIALANIAIVAQKLTASMA